MAAVAHNIMESNLVGTVEADSAQCGSNCSFPEVGQRVGGTTAVKVHKVLGTKRKGGAHISHLFADER